MVTKSNSFFVFCFVELTIELRIQKEWDDDLEDKESEAYRDLSFLLEKEVK